MKKLGTRFDRAVQDSYRGCQLRVQSSSHCTTVLLLYMMRRDVELTEDVEDNAMDRVPWQLRSRQSLSI